MLGCTAMLLICNAEPLGVGGYSSNNFIPMDRYPHCPLPYSIFYLMLPRRSEIERLRCIRRLMLAKRLTNEQRDRRGIALFCSSYLNEGLSSHYFVYLRSQRTENANTKGCPVRRVLDVIEINPMISCAALIRREDCPPSFFRGENFLHERLQVRVAAQIIKHWIGLKHKGIAGMFAVRSFQFVNRLLLFAQGQIQQGKTVGMNVARLRRVT